MAIPNDSFGELQEQIRRHGFLEPSRGFYIRRIVIALTLLAISIALLVTAKNFWIQMLNALFLAFVFGQLSLFFHDVGHGQVTGHRWHKMMSVCFSIMLGWDLDWWVYKHNRHHAFPNQPGYDPDIKIGLLAFSEDQARGKKGFSRVVARHQDILFIPLLLGEAWHLRCASIAYLFERRSWKHIVGLSLIGVHLVLYGALLLFFLSIGHAIAFAIVHWGALGIYLGLIFAPNHKGMPIIEHDVVRGFLEQQILTTRNVRGGWLVDMLYGGLNYQIEHHLFPSMPRNHLKSAAPVIEAFCREKNMPYYAVGARKSFQEIFRYLGRIGELTIRS